MERDDAVPVMNSHPHGEWPEASPLEHLNPHQGFVRPFHAAQLVGAVRLVLVS
jgi:hypothetical protein